MATYTTTVEDVINSSIVDSQNQTTNRTALLSYVERVSLRMLRESQWIFLRSKPTQFITQPSASHYWIGSGATPAGCVNTGLGITNLGSIIPDAVYDQSNSRKLTQDSQTVLRGPGLRYQDGTFRPDRPRSYHYDYNNPGTLSLYPPPDNQNGYQPVPLAPICSTVVAGSLLTDRAYYTVVTLVDSAGGESIASIEPSAINVPPYSLLTVEFNGMDVASASTVQYGFYNIYIGSNGSGPFYRQNPTPIAIGTSWQEPTVGANVGFFAPATEIFIPDTSGNTYALTVATNGQLSTTLDNAAISTLVFLTDANRNTWQLERLGGGQLTTQRVSNLPSFNPILQDANGVNWMVSVLTTGQLQTSVTGPVISPIAPQTSTIAEMLGYIISFQYQQAKIPITSTTQTLQIPDDYFDVVVAGVNYYVNLYTGKDGDLQAKAPAWKKEFMDGLSQMRRDLRINFRNTDVIMPDSVTQYATGVQTGYPYYFNWD
jgi:hypothetical protein